MSGRELVKNLLGVVAWCFAINFCFKLTEKLLPVAAHVSIWIGLMLIGLVYLVVSVREEKKVQEFSLNSVESFDGFVANGNFTVTAEDIGIEAFRTLAEEIKTNLASQRFSDLQAKVESVNEDERKISVSFYADAKDYSKIREHVGDAVTGAVGRAFVKQLQK